MDYLEQNVFSGTLGYSMVRIARLNDAFSRIFQLEAGPVEGQSLQEKDKRRRKEKAKKNIKKTLKSLKM